MGHAVDLLITPAGFQVLAEETDWSVGAGHTLPLGERCRDFFRPQGAAGEITYHNLHDMRDDLASGTVAVQAMIVIPCTMGRISAFATGRSADLVDRAADVTLKEGRPLLVVPRETPLSLIHLRNLTQLAEAGGIIVPAMPGFYHHPRDIGGLVDFMVGKVLDRLGLPQDCLQGWDLLKARQGASER